MFQVRIHGRGGQGVVTAAELLSVAAFLEGREAQAFPTFGSERTGAPVVAFCRMDDKPIRVREPITEPDAVIVQDPTLVHQVDLFAGLDESGYLLINTSRALADLGLASERIAASPTAKNRYLIRGGRLVAAPLSPPALLASPLFSLPWGAAGSKMVWRAAVADANTVWLISSVGPFDKMTARSRTFSNSRTFPGHA